MTDDVPQLFKVIYVGGGKPAYIVAVSFCDAFELANEFEMIKSIEFVFDESTPIMVTDKAGKA
jgi:hypothetical protein